MHGISDERHAASFAPLMPMHHLLAIDTNSLTTHLHCRTPLLMLSAIECAAAAVIQHLPPLRPITQQLMFPAVFTKRLSKVAMGCLYEKKEEMCDAWGTVVDVKSLWTEADMTPLLITLNKVLRTLAHSVTCLR